MPPTTCEEHLKMIEDRAEINSSIKIIQNDLSYIRNKVCKHVDEGEKEGGFRDRLLLLETDMKSLKKGLWLKTAVAGFIGGLAANATPEAMQLIMKLFFK